MRAVVFWSGLFVLLWNSGFIGAEFGLPYSGPFTLLLWRYLALTLITGGMALLRREVRRVPLRQIGRVALVGILSHGVWLSCVLVAIDRGVPAGIVALVVSLQPLLTGALSGPATGEHTAARQWIGLVIGFAGVAIAVGRRVVGGQPIAPVYYFLPLLSAAAITAASLIQRRAALCGADRGGLPMAYQLFVQSAATTVMLLGPAFLVEGLKTTWSVLYGASMVWLVLGVSLCAYALLWQLLTKVSATRVSSLFYLGPPVTMVMAWVAFGDTLQPTDALGLAIGGIGVLLVSLPRRPNTAARGTA